jgi:hypothetical protein
MLFGGSEKIGVSNAKANEQEREIQEYERAFAFRIAFVVGTNCMGFGLHDSGRAAAVVNWRENRYGTG